MSYDSLSDEALDSLHREVAAACRKRSGLLRPNEISEFLSADSKNFLGLGMSLPELLVSGEIQRNLRSFEKQEHAERQRRLDFVIRLSAEFQRLLEKGRFSTALARAAIEDVITGDWRRVKDWVDHFGFGYEADRGVDMSDAVALYREFKEILAEAWATRPEPPTEEGNLS